MCRKTCECSTAQCHPQTGACNDDSTLPLNATHAIIQTLNSTIANITNNLDRLVKNIVNIAPTSTAIPVLGNLENNPQVIVIKQQEVTPATPHIILHQPVGTQLLDNAAANSEVIHVITAWPSSNNGSSNLDLAAFGGIKTDIITEAPSAAEHDANLLTTLLIILLIIMIAVSMSSLYLYKRYQWQKRRIEAALAAQNAGVHQNSIEVATIEGAKKFGAKPLPDLPGIAQMVCNKIEGM